MAVLEAAYLALCLYLKPKSFTMNRQLVLNLCIIYTLMVVAPLEQRLYMKGENLTKAMLYTSTYFYKMIDGDAITESSIPYKRFIDESKPIYFAILKRFSYASQANCPMQRERSKT